MTNESTPVEKILDRLEDYKERQDEFRARCPVHQGNSEDSLTIKEGDDGRALLICRAGCDYKDIVDALGLQVVDLFAHNGRPGRSQQAKKATRKTGEASEEKILTTDELRDGTYFEFTSPAGQVLYIQRHKREYYRKAGADRWVTYKGVLDDITQVLYRLPELIDGVRSRKTVYHVEGCKDVDTARSKLGVVATTSGSTTSWRPEFASFYIGADVVIIPDNDDPGRKYADTVARDLAQIAGSVKVVELGDLPEGGDLTDWFEDGHTKDEFFEIVAAAPVYDPDVEEPWADPRPLDTGLPPVEKLTPSMLPEGLRDWVFDAAERMEMAPEDFIAVDAIVAIGSLVGRKISVRPKRYDEWAVIPNLWGATIGRPATMKSPAMRAALKPLKRLSTKATEEWQEASEEWKKVTQKVETAEENALRDELKAAAKKVAKDNNGNRQPVDDVVAKLQDFERDPEPVHKRYDTNDATVEKLTELLRDNPNGLLLHRDELMGFLRTMDRPGHENDRAFFLECWDGDLSYKGDRIERGFIHAEAVCLSILGGIQPGPLQNYVRDALAEEDRADGLLQRFQLLVWPDLRPYRRTDRAPNLEAISRVNKIFEIVDSFDASEFGAEEIADEVPFVRFSDDALKTFEDWRDEFEPQYVKGDSPAALESHFNKYRSLFASLALIFEIVSYAAQKAKLEEEGQGEVPDERYTVGKESALRAGMWCEYLASHARRLYHPALLAPVIAAQDLLEKIEEGSVTHGMKLRLVADKGWSGLTTTERVREAIEILEDHGWVRIEKIKPSGAGGGRPSEQIMIHPDLREGDR